MYIFINKKNGNILGVKIKDTSNKEYCNEASYTLTEDSELVFVAKSKEQAEKILKEDSKWYASSAKHPCHGNINPQDYEIKELIIK